MTEAREDDRVLITITDFCRAYGVGRTKTYELLSAGDLAAVRVGARTLITAESARAWAASLPTWRPA